MNNPAMKDDRTRELAKAIGDAVNDAMTEAKRRRAGIKLTQLELAKQCNLTQATVSRTLQGKTVPETATLLAISQYFTKLGIELNQALAPLLQEVQRLESPGGPAYIATPIIDKVVEIMRELGTEAQLRLLGMAELIQDDEKRQIKAQRQEAKRAGKDFVASQRSILGSPLPESLKTGIKSR